MFTKITRDVVDFVIRPLTAGTFQGVTIDSSPVGANTPSTGDFTNATANNLVVHNSATIVGGSIDGTPVGSTTPSTGRFTNLTATSGSTVNFTGATVLGLSPFSSSVLATNGHVVFGNGLIIQWFRGPAISTVDDTTETVAIPFPFPTAIFAAYVTSVNGQGICSNGFLQIEGLPTLSQVVIRNQVGGAPCSATTVPQFLMIGN